ncbi:hypothetical protein GCM10027429_15890 [Marivirga atlantica]|jgi:hypothetical protein|uniref:Uncharacterized protein n=1 Tax=Marivirga atlantica TaxID=1548457 RepID=A0A937AM48_9BACT|nr:hypothetical protein [Marivirga atlantica]MBL0765207.1 hypothetical protein [Marivirga atlantica]
MRGVSFYLLITLFIYSCSSKEEEQKEQGPQDFRRLSLSLASDNYYDTENYSGNLYLSNQNGEIVDQAELVNNATSELIMDYDSNSDFDLTTVDRYEFERSNKEFISYRLKTFNSIEPYNFEIKEPQIAYADSGASAFLNIANTGGNIRDIVTANYYNRNITSTEANFEIYLINQKEDIYLSFLPAGKDIPRYILLEDIENGFSTDYELADLPLANDQIVINYPQTDELSVEIWGAVQSDPENFFALLSSEWGSLNPPYSIHYIPTKEFVQFKQKTYLNIGNKEYQKMEIDNLINTVFTIPDLDFQIINSNNETFEFSPTTNYDYYSISMYYKNEAENYEIIWNHYGKSSNGNVKIRYPKLLEILGPETMPESVNDFKITNTEIKNIEGLGSYLEYCNAIMDPNVSLESKSNKIESLKIQ